MTSWCPHVLSLSKVELAQCQSRATSLWHKQAGHSACSIRSDNALVCLHCGHVGWWSPFQVKKVSGVGIQAQLHLTTKGHCLALHTNRLRVYCSYCGDFVGSASQLSQGEPAGHHEPSSQSLQRRAGNPRIRGIYNLGNTCFMSCILQALAHNSVNHKVSTEGNCLKRRQSAPRQQMHKMCLGCELEDFFTALFEYGDGNFIKALVPHRVLYATWMCSNHFAGYQQHDAHEYLMCILGTLVSHEKTATHEHFRGSFCSDIVCADCGIKNSRREPFLDVSLSIFNRPRSDSNTLTLEECLFHFTSVETLVDTHICEYCGAASQRLKQLTIDTLPRVLVVHLKRFDALASKKLSDIVLFPADSPLDLGPFLTKLHTADCAPPNHLYELNAVINHHGSLTCGHYTAHIKHGGNWFHCDDHLITPVDLDTVKRSEAYILFYKRKTTLFQAPDSRHLESAQSILEQQRRALHENLYRGKFTGPQRTPRLVAFPSRY